MCPTHDCITSLLSPGCCELINRVLMFGLSEVISIGGSDPFACSVEDNVRGVKVSLVSACTEDAGARFRYDDTTGVWLDRVRARTRISTGRATTGHTMEQNRTSADTSTRAHKHTHFLPE